MDKNIYFFYFLVGFSKFLLQFVTCGCYQYNVVLEGCREDHVLFIMLSGGALNKLGLQVCESLIQVGWERRMEGMMGGRGCMGGMIC